ncbi:MAG: carbohydrate kinase, partial [Clostridiales bacterium]|nr:carbohydrate kinase [Clostridiales bacterium]
MKKYLLGIDVGMSACKAGVFDFAGRCAAHSFVSYEAAYPGAGRAEIDPGKWYRAVCRALAELFASGRVKKGEIAAIGVDGVSWCAAPVDKGGGILADTPLWMDT